MGKLFGLLGHPVGHSMSPVFQNDAFANLGLDHYYQAFDVKEEEIQIAVEGLRALGVAGFNVTIPHKIAIMDYLDEIDEEAKIIGAVNTVVNKDGNLVGYNTDGQGYLESLLELTGDKIKQSNVLVIGAGGGARAIVTVLARYGVQKLSICNRTIEKAQALAKITQGKTEISTMTVREAESNLEQFDVIINTTSVGMSPNINEMPISLDNMKAEAVVSDLVYNPKETKLLRVAKEKGATVQNGIGMLVGQGALAFEMWTNKQPDRARMRDIIENKLGG